MLTLYPQIPDASHWCPIHPLTVRNGATAPDTPVAVGERFAWLLNMATMTWHQQPNPAKQMKLGGGGGYYWAEQDGDQYYQIADKLTAAAGVPVNTLQVVQYPGQDRGSKGCAMLSTGMASMSFGSTPISVNGFSYNGGVTDLGSAFSNLMGDRFAYPNGGIDSWHLRLAGVIGPDLKTGSLYRLATQTVHDGLPKTDEAGYAVGLQRPAVDSPLTFGNANGFNYITRHFGFVYYAGDRSTYATAAVRDAVRSWHP